MHRVSTWAGGRGGGGIVRATAAAAATCTEHAAPAARAVRRSAGPAAVPQPSPASRSCVQRAFSTHAAAAGVATATAARSPPPPPPAGSLDVAAVRALDVAGVVALVESLGVDADDARLLSAQKVDGATLLEMTEDKLCDRCRMPLGSAGAIMRAIAPAVAEAQRIAARAEAIAAAIAARAEAVTLLVYPPLGRGARNNPVMVTLTPAEFRAKYGASSLLLVSNDGAVLQDIVSLEQAVEATQRAGSSARLRASRSFDDSLQEVRGFVASAAEALE